MCDRKNIYSLEVLRTMVKQNSEDCRWSFIFSLSSMGPVTELQPEFQKIVDVFNSTKQLTIYGSPTNEEGKKPLRIVNH